jgi:hypothetical protein
LQLAKPYLRSVADESEWPGTQLSGHTATVYRYQLSVDFLALLKTRSRGLFDWVSTWNSNRELPEDMAIYRSDGSVLLGSIAHECEAWLELTPDEYRQASDLPLKLSKRS